MSSRVVRTALVGAIGLAVLASKVFFSSPHFRVENTLRNGVTHVVVRSTIEGAAIGVIAPGQARSFSLDVERDGEGDARVWIEWISQGRSYEKEQVVHLGNQIFKRHKLTIGR